jgi:hypothetical protein
MTRRQATRADAPWLLVLAAVIDLIVGIGVSAAQTVIVKNAPPGSTVELVLNAAPVGSTAASSSGYTTLAVGQSANSKPEIDALVFVDLCDNRRRVLIVERGLQAAPLEPECVRREITGLFVVRPISTLVVDVGGPIPTLLLRQGRFDPASGPRSWRPAPTGLVVFGGGSYTAFKDARAAVCGNVDNCSGADSGVGYTFGIAYWLLPFIAAEATYLKPANATAIGTGANYDFSNVVDADVLIVAGVAGLPVGPLRVYGKGGMTYHRALFATTETIDDSTITIDGVAQTIPGGTQKLEFQTGGWGWMFGGGLEAWMNRTFAIYGEFGWVALKGKDLDGGEGVMDDTLIQVLFGARVHLGR